jgi:hypothetical protein
MGWRVSLMDGRRGDDTLISTKEKSSSAGNNCDGDGSEGESGGFHEMADRNGEEIKAGNRKFCYYRRKCRDGLPPCPGIREEIRSS